MSYMANKDPIFHQFFMTMCPTYAFIDRANGRFNRGMSFKREYIALMSHAWEIDQLYNAYNSDPEATGEEMHRILGIGCPSDDPEHDDYKEALELISDVDQDNYFRQRFFGTVSADDLKDSLGLS